jgi:hypothetical protein
LSFWRSFLGWVAEWRPSWCRMWEFKLCNHQLWWAQTRTPKLWLRASSSLPHLFCFQRAHGSKYGSFLMQYGAKNWLIFSQFVKWIQAAAGYGRTL